MTHPITHHSDDCLCPRCNEVARTPSEAKELIAELQARLSELRKRVKELEAQVINQRSTIEAWNHAEIIKCGCKYQRVWGGMKWEHWLVPCAEHRAVFASEHQKG